MKPVYSADHKLLFYPILKVGSSGYRIALEAHGFTKYMGYNAAEDLADIDAFVLLRDPITRYLSAVAQMYRSYVAPTHRANWDQYVQAVAGINDATGVPWTRDGDPHFRAQADTVATMGQKRQMFQLGNSNYLWAWLYAGFGLDLVAPVSNPMPLNQLEDLESAIDPEPIRQFYRADLQLLERTLDDNSRNRPVRHS